MTDQLQPVLLVDDEYGTIELMASILEHEGFEVSLARSPQAAVSLLRTMQFDAVVTDVVFEGQALGEDLLQACRELCPDAVVLLMTGYPAVDSAVSAIKHGAIDYLQKPVDPLRLATTLHRAIRERRVKVETLDFHDLVDIMSAMVAQTIERVDPYTAGHGERTRAYCKAIAQRIGLDRRTIERLELAAIAHDYGKIYLDDLSFLTKQGPLTAKEYREVQRHPALGAKKLSGHSHLEEVCRYIAEHHERWDGGGYPYGLKHDQISMAGRILGVVEVFDSLSTRRSYKQPWDLPKVMDFFEDQSERAFDPEVVDSFLLLLERHGQDWLRQPERDRAAAAL